MSISRSNWRALMFIYFNCDEIYDLVNGWVDHETPSDFVTSWCQRYFFVRLMGRAFRELAYTNGLRSLVVEDVQLEGDECHGSKGLMPIAFCETSQYSLPFDASPYKWVNASPGEVDGPFPRNTTKEPL